MGTPPGSNSTILLLGFGAFFWFCVIGPRRRQHDPDVLKYVLAQSYIALMRHAAGLAAYF